MKGMRRDLIKRMLDQFALVLQELPEEAGIIHYYFERREPLPNAEYYRVVICVDSAFADKMAEEAEAWSARLQEESVEGGIRLFFETDYFSLSCYKWEDNYETL